MKDTREKLGYLQRAAELLAASVNLDARTVEISFSSELPVLRRGFFSDDFNEILDHSPQSIRLGRLNDGASVLENHDRARRLGVVEFASIDSDRRGRAVVRLGKGRRAKEALIDIADGILTKTSVGYVIYEADLIEAETKGEPDTLRAIDWEPHEISFVTVAADPSVGVGRGADDIPTLIHYRGCDPMNDKTKTPAEPPTVVDITAAAADKLRQGERTRIADIQATAAPWSHVPDLTVEAERAINEGHSVDQFRANIMPMLQSMKPDALAPRLPADQPKTLLGMSDGQAREYSVMKAIRALMCLRGLDSSSDPQKVAPFEIECSNAVADELGVEPRGILIPYDVQQRTPWQADPGLMARAHALEFTRTVPMGVATTGTVAAALKGTELLASAFIEALQARSVSLAAGAVPLPGLVGDVDIPKQTGLATFGWLAEDADGTDTEVAIGAVTLAPKTVSGPVPITRKLIKQSTPAVEQIVRNDLVNGAAQAIDIGILRGSGSAGQPEGIINVTGVLTQVVADVTGVKVPTHAELVGFETTVGAANALSDSAVYMTLWAVAGPLKTTLVDSGSGLFVWMNNVVNGRQAIATSNLATDQVIFGSFNQILLGMWGVLDINVDVATKAKSGGIVLRAFQDVDVGLRHPQAFCINTGP
jgi:HK97 family phage major capsid protein